MRAVVLAVPLAFGALVGGWVGLAVAATSLVCALDDRAWVRRLVAVLAIGLGIVMAVSTVTEGSLSGAGASFATDRPVAALAGQLAGILVVLIVGVALVDDDTELSSDTGRGTASPPGDSGRSPSPARALLDLLSDRIAVVTGLLVVAGGIVRTVADPEAMAPLYREVAANIERGAVYGLGSGVTVTESAVVAPAAPILAALGPFGAGFVLGGAGLVAAVLLVVAARRIAGARLAPVAGLAAAAATIVLPSWWGASLPAALVVVGVLGGWVLADPERVDGRRAVGAGLALALAALARPEALVAIPAVVVALVIARRRPAAWIVAGTALLAYSPWYLWVVRNFDTLRPTTGFGRDVEGTVTELPWGALGTAVDLALLAAALALVVVPRPGTRAALGRVRAAPAPLLLAAGVAFTLVAAGDPAARAIALPAAIVTIAVIVAAAATRSADVSAPQDEHAVPGGDLP